MPVRVVVSNPDTGSSYQVETDVDAYVGSAIGDEVDGGPVGLDGYTLEITGGSDDTGRPMRGDVEGQGIAEILVSGGTGYNPTRDGERRRVSVRGGAVGDATVQLNTRVVEEGSGDIDELLSEGDEDEDEEE
ncbi:MAG: 30S ribosomal protein S6e [Halobacteriales archaeon]|nr:30S ribosomal protein S6e [Halobacteriales archaeon]